ncbi:MAG: cytosolic protein, partial [Syntrophobacterales bacterium CG_4_8_14_3_um_filter_58_8]
MAQDVERVEGLSQEELVRLVVDFFHRTMVHHTLWFAEVEHQMGMAKALELLGAVWEKSGAIQMKRLSEAFDFEMENGVPKALAAMPKEKLLLLLGDLGRNWLAGDGVWFQGVEAGYGIWDAKRCNDSCWARFSPFEAW